LKVLFVCKANVCRSVMAEAFFKAAAAAAGLEAEASSAGLMAFAGVTPAPETAAAMREAGLDVAGHEANPLRPQDLMGSDLVVVMSASQKDAILRKLPALADKVKTLHEAGGDGAGDVEDPTDQSAEVLTGVRDLIRGLVRGLVDRIKAGSPT
jgi:protein-tyrosine-phosphatase